MKSWGVGKNPKSIGKRKKPKVAFCLHGIVGGMGGKYGEGDSVEALQLGYNHYKKFILDYNDCDVFCHTSTMERKPEILDLYKPVKSRFTEQPDFKIPHKNHTGGNAKRTQGHYHKWWSHKILSELRNEYEKETGTEYDVVYIGRYDLAWRVIVDFSYFDLTKFYLGNWNRLWKCDSVGRRQGEIPEWEWYNNCRNGTPHNIDNVPQVDNVITGLVGYPHNQEGVIDSWAFSNPKLMDIYCKLYDCLDEYVTREPNKWWNGKSTIYDHCGTISNHRLIPCHLESKGILDKLDFAFYFYDDFPVVRRLYRGR